MDEQDIMFCGLLNSWAADLVKLDPWTALGLPTKWKARLPKKMCDTEYICTCRVCSDPEDPLLG